MYVFTDLFKFQSLSASDQIKKIHAERGYKI